MPYERSSTVGGSLIATMSVLVSGSSVHDLPQVHSKKFWSTDLSLGISIIKDGSRIAPPKMESEDPSMKKHMLQTILSTALLSIAPLALAQEFPTTPKHETLQQAIQFQKQKDAADAAQARKEAGETANTSRATAAKTARVKSARKTGQADSSKQPAR